MCARACFGNRHVGRLTCLESWQGWLPTYTATPRRDRFEYLGIFLISLSSSGRATISITKNTEKCTKVIISPPGNVSFASEVMLFRLVLPREIARDSI